MPSILDEKLLDPAFGIRYIGYPAAASVLLTVLLSFVSTTIATGILLMTFGYVAVGVGFVCALVYYHRFTNELESNVS